MVMMQAKLRLGILLAALGLGFTPIPSFAQSVPDATSNTTTSGVVGPAELRNFSLPGTVTRPGDQAASQGATKPASSSSDQSSPAPVPRVAERRAPAASSDTPAVPLARTAPPPVRPRQQAASSQPIASSLGSSEPALVAQGLSLAPPLVSSPPAIPAPVPANAEFSLLPWLAAGLALALAGGFLLFLRSRRREAYGGPEFDLFTAGDSEPVPAPAPLKPSPQPFTSPPPPLRAPLPQASPPPKPASTGGIVSTRLRPSLEMAVLPLRCHSDGDQVVLEFELELFNSGPVPARAVLAEASLLNAGAAQDEQLAVFFANPVGQGEPFDVIAPLKRASFTSRVVAPRSSIEEYELGGRKAFVPVIAFNALYRWSGGQGQTSAAYLVGRETKGDKLGPLRLDDSSTEFRGLAAKQLPATLKT